MIGWSTSNLEGTCIDKMYYGNAKTLDLEKLLLKTCYNKTWTKNEEGGK